MGAFDECTDQLATALANWDWSVVFPVSGYTLPKGVEVVTGWPTEQFANLESLQKGQLEQPLVSLAEAPSDEEVRTFGNVYGPGSGQTTRYAKREVLFILLSCWADQHLGGGDMAKKLAGQAQGCVLYNCNRLASFRHLECRHQPGLRYDPAAELWHFDLTIRGESIVSVDA